MRDFPDSGLPIYTQIMAAVKRDIACGGWPPGSRVPPVRELAVRFGVNPNTAQRALTELERENLLYSERTSGRFVTRDASAIAAAKESMARELVGDFLGGMKSLGYTPAEIKAFLAAIANETGGGDKQ